MKGRELGFWALAAAGCAAAPPPQPVEAAPSSATVDAPQAVDDATPPPTTAASSVAPPAPAASPAPALAPFTMPTACANGDKDTDFCMPGVEFADRVCAASRPEVALALFSKGSPWTRLYLRGNVDGWNAEGGGSARALLEFDEEVVVLKRRAPAGGKGVIVSDSGGYQVMRWDGNCYSLDDGEVTRKRPPRAKHPGIPWRHLSEKTKGLLLGNATVKAAYDKRGKECKGATVGVVSAACEQADTEFSDGIVTAIKSGLALPTPEL